MPLRRCRAEVAEAALRCHGTGDAAVGLCVKSTPILPHLIHVYTSIRRRRQHLPLEMAIEPNFVNILKRTE